LFQPVDTEKLSLPADIPVDARALARLDFAQALAKPANYRGPTLRDRLELDDKRPTYEIAMLDMTRFFEIEIAPKPGGYRNRGRDRGARPRP